MSNGDLTKILGKPKNKPITDVKSILGEPELKKKEPTEFSDGSLLTGQNDQQESQLPSESEQAKISEPQTEEGFRTVASPTQKPKVQYETDQIETFTEQPKMPVTPTGESVIGKTPKKTKEEEINQRVKEKIKTRYGGTLTPDEQIAQISNIKSILDNKYSQLLTEVDSNSEKEKIISEYQKELDSEASKIGLDKKGNRYTIPDNTIEFYKKQLDWVMGEINAEEKDKNKSFLKAANYKLLAGVQSFGATTASLIGQGKSFQEAANYYSEKAQEHYGNLEEYERKKDYIGAVGATALNVVETIPILASFIAGNKAGALNETAVLLGIGEGEKKYEEIKDLDIPTSAKVFNSVGTAINFIALSKVGGGEISNNVNALVKSVGLDQTKALLQKSTQSLLQNSIETIYKGTSPALRGYAIGWSSSFANNLVDKATIDPERDLSQGNNEAGLTWALMEKISTGYKDIESAKQDIQVAMGKVPRNMPIEDFARATEMVLEKDNLTKSNELLDEMFQETNQKRVDEIKNQINFLTKSRDVKEQVNTINDYLNTEIQKEKPNIDQISKVNESLNKIEQDVRIPEIDPINKQLDGLFKKRESAENKSEFDSDIISLLKERQEKKQKFYDETIKGINDPLDMELHTRDKQQAIDELKKTLPDINLKSNENEKVGKEEGERLLESPQETKKENTPSELTEGVELTTKNESKINDSIYPETTSIKKANVQAERESRGIPQIEQAIKRDWANTVIKEAKEKIETGEINPRVFAEHIKNKPRSLTDTEDAVLALDRMRLYNEHKTANEKLIKAKEGNNQEAYAEALTEINYIENAINDNDLASTRGGTETARGLNARKIMIAQDYSVANIIQKARVANLGEQISEPTRVKLTELQKQLDEALKREEKYKEELVNVKTGKLFEQLVKEVEFQKRKQERTIKAEDLDKEFSDLTKQYTKLSMGQLSAGINPELVVIIGKMAKNRISKGINSLEGVIDSIYTELSKNISGIKKEDINSALSEFYDKPELTKDILQGQLKSLKKELKNADKAKLSPEEKSLQSYKKRLENRISELEKKLQEKDFTVKPRKKINLDPEALEMKAKTEKLKKQIDQEIEKIKLQNRTKLEKGIDWFNKWRRFQLLSSVFTLGKLTMAATNRMILNPIEDIVGGVLSKIPGINKVAEQSPRHGSGLNIEAESKAISQLWKKENLDDIIEVIKTGKSSLDYIYGNKSDLPPEALDFFGHLHGALKVTPKRNEFFRSFEKRLQFYAKKGEDITRPDVQARIGAEAYIDANRAIFMNDNKVLVPYKIVLSYLKNIKEPSLSGKAGKLVAGAMQTVFPIVKVPVNYVAESTSYGIGAFQALGQVIAAGGVKKLTPAEADFVMRVLKKNTIGLGFFAIGYFNPQSVGGYYQQYEKRKEGDLKPGDLVIFGAKIPHWMLHTPVLEMLQLGSTVRRVQEKYALSDPDKSSVMVAAEGIWQGGKGLLSQVPFLEEPSRIAESMGNLESFSEYGAELTKSLILPPDVQKLAKSIDTNEAGEPIKRKPEGFIETIESGIPGLRKNVPSEQDVESEKRVKVFEKFNDPNKLLDTELISEYTDLAHKFNQIMDSRGKYRKEIDALATEKEKLDYIEKNDLKKDMLFAYDNSTNINKIETIINYYNEQPADQQKRLKSQIEKIMKNLLNAYRNDKKFKLDYEDEKLVAKQPEITAKKQEEKKKLLKKIR